MNVHAINQGLTIAENALKEMMSAQKKLSAGKKNDEIGQLLKNARERLKEAEARIAHEMEFPICKRCWPPEIMLQNEHGAYICRSCNKEMSAVDASNIPDNDDISTW